METQSIKNRFGIIGNAPALNHALKTAIQVAATDLTVLIMGESGVGKEAFSNIIHSLSARKHNPFIAVNCGAIPEGTIDSELFGHEKGAFTGAVDSRKGYFETVNGGTIFLDEIGEMPLGTQARLLRVLETGEFIRVGSSKVQKTDVRVIAATNRDLLDFTRDNKFRVDLYYRLSTVPIRVPALRERVEDISLLFRKFASDFAEKYKSAAVQLDEGARKKIESYSWPGNIRELKNLAEQVSVLSSEKWITAEAMDGFLPADRSKSLALMPRHSLPHGPHSGSAYDSTTERDILYKLFFELKKDISEIKQLIYELIPGGAARFGPPGAQPENLLPSYSPGTGDHHSGGSGNYGAHPPLLLQPKESLDEHEEVEESLQLAEREKEFIQKALIRHKGRRRDAANELGISERTLYRKIKEYGIRD